MCPHCEELVDELVEQQVQLEDLLDRVAELEDLIFGDDEELE